MKVLLVAGVDVSRPGGVETHVRELAHALTGLGHDVHLFAPTSALPPFTVVQTADASPYDVVHHHGPGWPRNAPLGAAVRTLHFCVAAKMAAYVKLGRLRTLVNPLNWAAAEEERAAWRRTWALIAISQRMRDEFTRHHGAPGGAVHVIPSGVTAPAATDSRDAVRDRYGIPRDARVALTVGRDDFVKGFGLFGRAWARSRVAERGALWVTAGGGSRSQTPGRLVTGPIAHAEVLALIGASDVGAFPSHYESGGIALLEMLQGGLYVLSHDVGLAREVVRTGENGELVAPVSAAWERALVRWMEAAPATAPTGLAGDFSWSSVARRVTAVYETAAGAPAT